MYVAQMTAACSDPAQSPRQRRCAWQRAAYVTTFTTMSVANLAWAIGSLVPDERQSRALRLLFNPLAVVMLFSLGAALAFMLGCGS